jgi:hypothetical protein
MNLMSPQGGVDAGQERVTSLGSPAAARHPATLTEIARARGSGAGASTSRWKRITSPIGGPQVTPPQAEDAEPCPPGARGRDPGVSRVRPGHNAWSRSPAVPFPFVWITGTARKVARRVD